MNYIILSSKKRTTGYSPAKFRVQLKDSLIGKYSLYSALVPNTSPVLTSTALVIKIGGTESTIFVNPTDVYTVTQAITALQNGLNAVSNIFTVTQDVDTKRIKVA